MKPPKSYFEWSECFDQFESEKNDEEVLLAMQKGKLPWVPGVKQRIVNRMQEACQKRLNRASEQFQRSLDRSMMEHDYVQAIIQFRKKLTRVHQFTQLSVFPKEVREEFHKMLEKYAQDMQAGLEESARTHDPSGSLLRMVRHNPVQLKPEAFQEAKSQPEIKSKKRRIIF